MGVLLLGNGASECVMGTIKQRFMHCGTVCIKGDTFLLRNST